MYLLPPSNEILLCIFFFFVNGLVHKPSLITTKYVNCPFVSHTMNSQKQNAGNSPRKKAVQKACSLLMKLAGQLVVHGLG